MIIPIGDLGSISRFVITVLFVWAGRTDLAILYVLLLIYLRLIPKIGTKDSAGSTFVSKSNPERK